MSKEQKEKERKARGDEIRSAQMTFLRLLVCNLVEGSRLRRRSWNSSLSNCRRFAGCSGSCCPSSLCCSQFRPCSKRNRLRCSSRGRCIRLVPGRSYFQLSQVLCCSLRQLSSSPPQAAPRRLSWAHSKERHLLERTP